MEYQTVKMGEMHDTYRWMIQFLMLCVKEEDVDFAGLL